MLTGGVYKYSKHLDRRKLHLIFIVNKYFFLFVLVMKSNITMDLLLVNRKTQYFINIFVTICKDYSFLI